MILSARARLPACTASIVLALAIACAAFGVYAGTLSFPLLWDDPKLVERASTLVGQGGLPALLAAEFRLDPLQPTGFYRPVVQLSLYADSQVARYIPSISHLTNVLLHAAVSALVFTLLLLVSGSRRAAAAGGLLFAVHPAHTENVAFISGRTDLWAMFFVLLATISWASERTRPGPSSSARVAGLLCFGLALLSKETSFALPGVLLLWDLLLVPADRPPGQTWLGRNRFWLAGWGAVALLAILLRGAVVGLSLGAAGGIQAARYPFPALAAAATTALKLLVVPWPLKTHYATVDLSPTLLTAAAGVAVVALCAVCSGRTCRRAGLLALAWMVLFHLPASGLVPMVGNVFAERFLYLPSLGIALVAGVALDRLAAVRGWRLPAWSLLFLVCVLFSHAAIVRARVWEDQLTLAGDMTRGSPRNPLAHFSLGTVYQRLGRYEDAVSAYLEAQRLDPASTLFCNNLGNSYAALGRHSKALEVYRECVRLGSKNPRLFANLGGVALFLGRPHEALEAYREVLRLAPDYPLHYPDFPVYLRAAEQQAQRVDDAPRPSGAE